MDVDLRSLGLDSFAVVAATVELERHFAVTVNDEDLADIRTVRGYISLFTSAPSHRGGTGAG